eukprot:1190988-Prorocentrum_minimum.AAC.8
MLWPGAGHTGVTLTDFRLPYACVTQVFQFVWQLDPKLDDGLPWALPPNPVEEWFKTHPRSGLEGHSDGGGRGSLAEARAERRRHVQQCAPFGRQK